jgi:pimeloyl-ACP methyl ester carboxylesterase
VRTLALVALVALAVACSQQSSQPAVSPGPRVLTGQIGAAAYLIDVPAPWNGTLFLWSHGYAAPGSANPAQDAPSSYGRTWLLDHHYALAGSSYSSTGWAVADALKDQIALLDFFGTHVGKPKRVIAWGASLGGIITAGLIQLHPDRFAAAMPLCGVLSGGIASWNTELDGAYAFKMLLAPGSGIQLVHITDGTANLQLALQAFNQAAATPQGRARLALMAALIDLPGWFDPTAAEPAPGDYAARAQAQDTWLSRVDFAFAFRYRAELEQRAGGNPSWNLGVDYRQELSASPDRDEVIALYRAAGLNLQADLGVLDSGARFGADPAAASYLEQNISFDGRLSVPVLSIHTTGDGLVVPPNENAYAEVVAAGGGQNLLRQVFVDRAGHCTFTPGETAAALQQLLNRLDTGSWDDGALQPAALDAAAAAQGPGANSFFGAAVPPAFNAFHPTAYARRFDKGSAIPT